MSGEGEPAGRSDVEEVAGAAAETAETKSGGRERRARTRHSQGNMNTYYYKMQLCCSR